MIPEKKIKNGKIITIMPSYMLCIACNQLSISKEKHNRIKIIVDITTHATTALVVPFVVGF